MGNCSFRFENLEVWERAMDIGRRLFGIANGLEGNRLYCFAEQLRGAGLSISSNIAEESVSDS
jgi:four helix bundle protein